LYKHSITQVVGKHSTHQADQQDYVLNFGVLVVQEDFHQVLLMHMLVAADLQM
jgi:hypothetical protein